MIGASGDGGGRRHDALLVAGGGAGRPDARRHQHHVSADDRAQQRRLLARADEPVDTDVARLSGAFGDELRNREIITGRGEIGVVVGGEHGDGEKAQGGAFARIDRGMHGLWIGVHREKRCPQPGNAFDAPGDGVADIVQLEVEEDALARAGEHAREVDPTRKGKLITDLVERNGFAEPRDQRLRLGNRRHVERDDQPLARIKLHGRPPPRASRMRCRVATPHANSLAVSMSLRTTTLSWLAARVSLSSSISSKACSAFGTVTCSAITSARQPTASTCRSASNECVAPERPGEAPPRAKTRFWEAASGGSPRSRTAEIQSIGFLINGVIEALYSGLAMNTP